MDRRSCLTVVLLLCGCTTDLRPEALQARDAAGDAEAARALLLAAEQAQYASEEATPWRRTPGAEARFTDAYEGLTGAWLCPWPEDPQRLRLRWVPARSRGVVELLTEGGPPYDQWGRHEGNLWRREEGAVRATYYMEDDDITFWLPTLEYFLEAAFRLGREAEIVDLAEPATFQGRLCDRVYATWGSYAPNDDLDQYLLWIARDTGRLVRMDFTVRDVLDFVSYSAYYGDYREVGGYVLPHRVQIGAEPDDLLHTLTVSEWRPNVEIPEEAYAPEAHRGSR